MFSRVHTFNTKTLRYAAQVLTSTQSRKRSFSNKQLTSELGQWGNMPCVERRHTYCTASESASYMPAILRSLLMHEEN